MTTKKLKHKQPQLPPPPSELFQPTIATVSTAQILQSVGFHRSQTSALDAMSHIATLYLQAIARSASSSANSAGRTHCNLLDVVSALEDVSSVKGFAGAAAGDRRVFRSSVLRDIMWFVWSIDEIPFAKPIPRRERTVRSEFGRGGAGSHIPAWLPAFPEESTYKRVGVDGRVWREENIRFRDELKDHEKEEGVVGRSSGGNEKKKKSFLPAKRGKVKFKFGVDLGSNLGVNVELGTRNGVCRGGKRVSCGNLGDDEKIKGFNRAKRAR